MESTERTPPPTDRLEAFKVREAEFRDATKKWILAQDATFKALAKTEFARKNRPIRHPNGKTFERGSYEYFWTDALWCGDVGTDPLIEFFEIDPADDTSDEEREWASQIFDECFREVMPKEMHFVLEG